MLAYQMVGIADENGKTYESEYGVYNKKSGFVFKTEIVKYMTPETIADKLFHEDCWRLKRDDKKLTKKQLEELLGFKFQLVDKEEDSDFDKLDLDEEDEELEHELFKNYILSMLGGSYD